MAGDCFVFREPRSITELRELLQLRCNVYKNSRFGSGSNFTYAQGLELDCYDLRAMHYGLFRCRNQELRPVGYIRIVTNSASPFEREIREIAADHPSLAGAVCKMPGEPLPLMTYFPDPEIVRRYYYKLQSEEKRLEEAGRLSLDRSVRSLKLAWHLVAFSFSAQMMRVIDETVITCMPKHKNFYSLFGFRILKGTTQHYCPTVGYTFLCMIVTNQQPASGVKEKLFQMADTFQRTKSLIYDPSSPEHDRKSQLSLNLAA